MDEILKKLLESELLSEETRTELAEQMAASVTAFKETLREEVETEVKSQLTEQWVRERNALIESVEQFITEGLTKELDELRTDVSEYRDQEAAYAAKIEEQEVAYAARLVEEKKAMGEKLAEELDALVDKIDDFFEVRLTEELAELKEDISAAKENEFGRRMFESFSEEFARSFVDHDATASKMRVAEGKLQDAEARIAELEKAQETMIRESKLSALLAPLTGDKRDQMSIILEGVATERLEAAYNKFIGRVLSEAAKTEEAPADLVEDAVPTKPAKTTVVTGDIVTESTVVAKVMNDDTRRARELAGIK